jgi:hypothetical protein
MHERSMSDGYAGGNPGGGRGSGGNGGTGGGDGGGGCGMVSAGLRQTTCRLLAEDVSSSVSTAAYPMYDLLVPLVVYVNE